MLKAYLHPKKKPNERHWYAYACHSMARYRHRQPRPGTRSCSSPACPRHQGHVTLMRPDPQAPHSGQIVKAAPWCVGSNLERYKWKAPEVSDSSPHTGEDGYLVLPTMPDDDKVVA